MTCHSAIIYNWLHFEGESKVDVLMNNAGVMMLPEGKTVDGYETQFATNVLGTDNTTRF